MYKFPIADMRFAREMTHAAARPAELAAYEATSLVRMVRGLRTRHPHLREDAVAMTRWLLMKLRMLRCIRN